MKKALIPLSLRTFAAFALASAFSLPALAAAPATAMAKPAAPGCAGKVFVKPGQNIKSGHSYLFMMVFKTGTGGKYFGNADYATTGCIGVVPDPKAAAKASAKPAANVGGDGDVYPADVCPTDCTDPPDDGGGNGARARGSKVGVKPLDKGTDPLGTYNWGVLSALETPIGMPVADNTFEVWQVKVKDACMAKELYAYYSQSGQFLATARAAGDFMGQMLMGFRVKANGQSEACK